jgi:tetratricopeptide (TPR) repeat protein
VSYYLLGKKEESRKQNAENICKTLEYLQSELQIIGFSWEEEGKFEEAYTCFRLNSDLYDLMVGEREDEMPFCLARSHTECALNCMRLNRPDEAMDWLEKMVRHERITAKNYNVITETQLPYLYGQTKHYSANSYRRTDKLLPILEWDIFDPIRDTDRFQAILADAESFEKGE